MKSLKTSSTISDILNENQQVATKNKNFFIWMPVNVFLLSFILYDIWKHSRSNTFTSILEHVVASVLSLNILYLCCQRFLMQHFRKRGNISFQQFIALRNFYNDVKDGSHDLKVVSNEPISPTVQKEKISFEQFRASTSPIRMNTGSPVKANLSNDNLKLDKFSMKTYHTSPVTISSGTPIVIDASLENSFQNTSVDRFLGLTGNYDSVVSHSLNNSNLSRSFSAYGKDDDVDSFKKSFDSTEFKSPSNISSEFTHYWISKDSSLYRNQNIQRSDIILNDMYQLSPTTALESVKPVNEVSSLGANSAICKKFEVNPAYISEWIANLRMWITQTILKRIIKEIQHVNSALSSHGVSNVNIGNSGIERLKKAAAMSHVSQNIPSLSSLISFLDVSTNQEYVVQRITALSTGSMSNYCWNSGGAYEGKPWNESLPTDAVLVMHLIAAYFDSQLFPLPHTAPDGRQFSSAHYVKTPGVTPKSNKSVIIYQQRTNPPHFQLVIGEEIYDISRGRNNLFHVLLFFLQHIKMKESGMFEHVNLGSSGINMLWIIEEPTHINIYKKSL